jgi:hypothetical protein
MVMTKVYVPTTATRIPRRRVRKLLASSVVSVTALLGCGFVLSACDSGNPPDCAKADGFGISASGTNATCRFSPSYQNDAGQPVVWIDVLCDTPFGLRWTSGPSSNIANKTDDFTAQASCYPNRVDAVNPRSKHS